MRQLERRARRSRSSIASCGITWRRWASGGSRKSRAGWGLDVEEVQEAIGRIARLEPRPGRAFVPDNNQYILPEVFVQQGGRRVSGHDQQRTDSASAHQQHLQGFDGAVRKLRRRCMNYIREKIRAGKFLIKSLHQRQQTILNIGQGDREAPAGIHGKGRGVPQADDDGAGGGGGGRA